MQPASVLHDAGLFAAQLLTWRASVRSLRLQNLSLHALPVAWTALSPHGNVFPSPILGHTCQVQRR